jgi:hypothetical protein
VQTASPAEKWTSEIFSLARSHPCSRHQLFSVLTCADLDLTAEKAGRFLKNYDAHASLLRRLLLKAATLMPEPAVGYVLENVRNEYGNGNYATNHQNQLREVAVAAGCSVAQFMSSPVMPGIRRFLQKVSQLYYPVSEKGFASLLKPAIAAGAITATEILAVEEFRAMHIAFSRIGCGQHIWFNHVLLEQEHTDESVALAVYFAQHHKAFEAVQVGLVGVLDANLDLYDGLLEALTS